MNSEVEMDRLLQLLLLLASTIGAKGLARKIEAYQEKAEYDMKAMLGVLVEVVDPNTRKKSKLMEFHDRSNQVIVKYYILQYKTGITYEGEPTIIINDFLIGLKADKNPVIDITLVYDSEEQRDADLYELNLLLK